MDGVEYVTREDIRWALVEGGFLEVPAGSKLYGVMVGDKVRVITTMSYKGPALDTNYYAAIGNVIAGVFDEVWFGKIAVSFAASIDWKAYSLTVDIPITAVGITPWTPGWFDLYTKITSPLVVSAKLLDVIEILLKPEFKDFTILSYDKIAGA